MAILGAAAGVATTIGLVGGGISGLETITGALGFGGSKKKQQYWTPSRVKANYEKVNLNVATGALAKAEERVQKAATLQDLEHAQHWYSESRKNRDARMVENHRAVPGWSKSFADATIQRVRSYANPIWDAGQREVTRIIEQRRIELGIAVEPARTAEGTVVGDVAQRGISYSGGSPLFGGSPMLTGQAGDGGVSPLLIVGGLGLGYLLLRSLL